MQDIQQRILERLFALQDPDYRAFQCRLMPTIPPEQVIGIRTPALRLLAKELSGTPDAAAFLQRLPHRYFDENNLHSFLIGRLHDFDEAMASVEAFLPFIDNWATCDQLNCAVFRKNLPALLAHIHLWLASGQTYSIRFAIGMLMRYYLDDAFDPAYPALVAEIRSEEYYVNMMAAWYFATALAKQWDAALPYLTEQRLEKWTHNKTIQKAIESYRITDTQKAALRALKL